MDLKQDRRQFLFKTAGVATIASSGFVISTQAHAGLKFSADSSEEGRCATCEYWGGIRKVSEDGKTIDISSLGWCNNPDSHNYHNTTTPETGPMKSWKKWSILS